jgi:hypothetical protein
MVELRKRKEKKKQKKKNKKKGENHRLKLDGIASTWE